MSGDDDDIFSFRRNDSIYSSAFNHDSDSEDDNDDFDHSASNQTGKEQEKMIEQIRKENFDLKLKIYNEQQNTEKFKATLITYEQRMNDMQHQVDSFEHEKKTFQITISKLRNEVQDLKKQKLLLEQKLIKSEPQPDTETTNTPAVATTTTEIAQEPAPVQPVEETKKPAESESFLNEKYFNSLKISDINPTGGTMDDADLRSSPLIGRKDASLKRNATTIEAVGNRATFTGKHVNIIPRVSPYASQRELDNNHHQSSATNADTSKNLFSKLLKKKKGPKK